MVFKTAILQMRSVNKDANKNTETIISKMKKASENNADILLLPECFITGYYLPIKNSDALPDKSNYIEKICTFAKEYHIGVVATAFTQGTDKPQNSAFVINKNGKILMKYSKVHTCDFADEKCLQNGNEFKVCDFTVLKSVL